MFEIGELIIGLLLLVGPPALFTYLKGGEKKLSNRQQTVLMLGWSSLSYLIIEFKNISSGISGLEIVEVVIAIAVGAGFVACGMGLGDYLYREYREPQKKRKDEDEIKREEQKLEKEKLIHEYKQNLIIYYNQLLFCNKVLQNNEEAIEKCWNQETQWEKEEIERICNNEFEDVKSLIMIYDKIADFPSVFDKNIPLIEQTQRAFSRVYACQKRCIEYNLDEYIQIERSAKKHYYECLSQLSDFIDRYCYE